VRGTLDHWAHNLVEIVRRAVVKFAAHGLVQGGLVDVTILVTDARKVTVVIVYALLVFHKGYHVGSEFNKSSFHGVVEETSRALGEEACLEAGHRVTEEFLQGEHSNEEE